MRSRSGVESAISLNRNAAIFPTIDGRFSANFVYIEAIHTTSSERVCGNRSPRPAQRGEGVGVRGDPRAMPLTPAPLSPSSDGARGPKPNFFTPLSREEGEGSQNTTLVACVAYFEILRCASPAQDDVLRLNRASTELAAPGTPLHLSARARR